MLDFMLAAVRRVYAAARRFIESVVFDQPAGIDTAKVLRLDEVGLAASNRQDYHPTPWLPLKRAFRDQNVTREDVLIDFGCGKGRVLFQAAMYPFRRVIGVELSAELAEIARRNVARSLPSFRCQDVQVINADVLTYAIPDDITIAYFFDPFHGEVFQAVLDKLVASVRRGPRELTIIYMDPHEEDALLKAGARLIKTSRGLRPTEQWARENSIRVYKLGGPRA